MIVDKNVRFIYIASSTPAHTYQLAELIAKAEWLLKICSPFGSSVTISCPIRQEIIIALMNEQIRMLK